MWWLHGVAPCQEFPREFSCTARVGTTENMQIAKVWSMEEGEWANRDDIWNRGIKRKKISLVKLRSAPIFWQKNSEWHPFYKERNDWFPICQCLVTAGLWEPPRDMVKGFRDTTAGTLWQKNIGWNQEALSHILAPSKRIQDWASRDASIKGQGRKSDSVSQVWTT